MTETDALLRPEQVGDVVPGITSRALAQMRYRRTGPAFVQHVPGGKVWYRLSDLRAWVGQNVHDPSETTAGGAA